MSNHLAKCISTNCPKYSDCARAVSESTAEMMYWIYCCPNGDYSYKDFEWYIEGEVSVIHSENSTENDRGSDLNSVVDDCMGKVESAL